jgi:hypothetical protein
VIRVAVASLALSGCAVAGHVQFLPVVNPTTYDASCCVAYVELDKNTGASLEVQKTSTTWSISTNLHFKF